MPAGAAGIPRRHFERVCVRGTRGARSAQPAQAMRAGLGAGHPRPSFPRLPPGCRGGRAVRRGAWRRRRAGCCCCCCWAASRCAAGRGPSRAGRRGSGKGAACATSTARAETRGPPSLTTASTSASASWRRGRRSSPARSRWRGKGRGPPPAPRGRGPQRRAGGGAAGDVLSRVREGRGCSRHPRSVWVCVQGWTG